MEKKFHDHTGERKNGFQIVFLLQGSVFKSVLPWVIFFSLYSLLTALVRHWIQFNPLPGINTAVKDILLTFNLLLSLLLIFRTNSAHERYWEGRKLWGSLVNTTRNLSRGILIFISTSSTEQIAIKKAHIELVAAFPIAMKLHLRREVLNEELKQFICPSRYTRLEIIQHRPLEIALWLGEYLQEQHRCDRLNVYQLNTLHKLVDDLINILGGCERILKTPAPLAYSIFLKQMLIIYCLILPIELVIHLHWWTALVMALFSLVVFGIEEIGSELENPFGRNPNDLPLDRICQTIASNIEELLKPQPHGEIYKQVVEIDNW